jgi:hypothetical protein
LKPSQWGHFKPSRRGEATAEALLEFVELLDVEVVGVDVVRERCESVVVEERDPGRGCELCCHLVAAGSFLC